MPRFDICLTDGVSLEVSFSGEYADLREAASVARERAQERMEGHPEVPNWSDWQIQIVASPENSSHPSGPALLVIPFSEIKPGSN